MSKPSRTSGLEQLNSPEIEYLPGSNSQGAPKAQYVSLELDFACYDQLPRRVQRFIQASILDRDTIELLDIYRELDGDPDLLLEILYDDERDVQRANPYTNQDVRPLPYDRDPRHHRHRHSRSAPRR